MIDWKWIAGIAVGAAGIGCTIYFGLRKKRKDEGRSLELPEIIIPQTRDIWKKSNLISPEEILGVFRPYYEYYYGRSEDDQIRDALREGENVLILGAPLSGKTRAAYEALVNMEQAHDVYIPEYKDIDPDAFKIPEKFVSGTAPKLVFLDDLQRFATQKNVEVLLREISKQKLQILATCRSEKEYKDACDRLSTKNIYIESIFGDNIVGLKKVDKETAQGAAKKVGIEWAKVEFDGNIGSVFMPLSEMRRRHEKCSSEEKTILGTISTLYRFGIYLGPEIFPREWIKRVAETKGLGAKDYDWDTWLDALKKSEFIAIHKDLVHSEEVYLEKIVSPLYEETDIVFYERLIELFKDVPDALVMIGDKADVVGKHRLDVVKFMHVAIKAFQAALGKWTKEKQPLGFAYANNGIGISFCRLAEVEEKTHNCENAINAFRRALEVYTLDNLPEEYSMTQNNLGNAYCRLAEVDGKRENSKLAIRAFKEALKVRTLDRFPIGYAIAQVNLGGAYRMLAEVEGKAENCRLAVGAFLSAISVFTLERFSKWRADTQNNLGIAYCVLAEVEGRAENCRLAIGAFQEALKVRTLDHFPIDYAMTQTNLGNAYGNLAVVEHKAHNCRFAIWAHEEALGVYTIDHFPMDYALTKSNLGNVYQILAGAEEKAENCNNAIKAFKESLEVYNIERFPIQYAMTQNNLGNAYRTLAEVECKAENCLSAIGAYQEALKIYNERNFPEVYPRVMRNLARSLHFCKDVLPERKANNP